MQIIQYPDPSDWQDLIRRPATPSEDLDGVVKEILDTVGNEGDAALMRYTAQLDGVSPDTLKVSAAEIKSARVDEELEEAILLAAHNIESFHRQQLIEEPVIETMPGVSCWRRALPIESIGLYIPGGTAPLFSTVLMLGIPAKIAGCPEVVLCTPPTRNGAIDPAILVCARIVGITSIFRVGGAQAIAAMAHGTESVPRVCKIFGPGNQYVTRAKELVQMEGIAIDMPAGPSELLVIADRNANPEFVAADLLSQAEHGPDSQVVLLCTDVQVVNSVLEEIQLQVAALPRREITEAALANSRAVILPSLDACMRFSNTYAPEHLIIATDHARSLASQVVNAGSVFIGPFSCESAGDYASGTNHTLPTNGFARSYSGVSIESFIKNITFQEITAEGLQAIGPSVARMAQAEQLQGHKNAVDTRLKTLYDAEN